MAKTGPARRAGIVAGRAFGQIQTQTVPTFASDQNLSGEKLKGQDMASAEVVGQGQEGVMPPTILFSRMEDGNHPVRVWGAKSTRRRYEVSRPDGRAVYNSTKDFLAGERGTTAHWTHDQYFKLGKWNPIERQPLLTVLDLFQSAHTAEALSISTCRSRRRVSFKGDPAITTAVGGSAARGPGRGRVPLGVVGPLGIDLENRSGEVVKLFYKGYGSWVRKSQFDTDDMMQEVYKGILVRNQGRCPWDPAKSSFGSYVTMVAGGVISNHHRRTMRRRGREIVGVRGWDNGSLIDIDVAESNTLSTSDGHWADPEPEGLGNERPVDRLLDYLADHVTGQELDQLQAIASMLDHGFKRHEIPSKLRLTKIQYAALLKSLRAWTASWAESERD
jgi:DNA-directed RNA polymerase specialized sigma24 family protein